MAQQEQYTQWVIKECWITHVKKMHEKHQPFVTYSTFRHRVSDYKRPLYKAINTPANVQYRDMDRRRKVRFYKVKMFFRKLFNREWNEK